MGSWVVRGLACLGFLTRQRVTTWSGMSFGPRGLCASGDGDPRPGQPTTRSITERRGPSQSSDCRRSGHVPGWPNSVRPSHADGEGGTGLAPHHPLPCSPPPAVLSRPTWVCIRLWNEPWTSQLTVNSESSQQTAPPWVVREPLDLQPVWQRDRSRGPFLQTVQPPWLPCDQDQEPDSGPWPPGPAGPDPAASPPPSRSASFHLPTRPCRPPGSDLHARATRVPLSTAYVCQNPLPADSTWLTPSPLSGLHSYVTDRAEPVVSPFLKPYPPRALSITLVFIWGLHILTSILLFLNVCYCLYLLSSRGYIS